MQTVDTSDILDISILLSAFRTITTILSYIQSPKRSLSFETRSRGDGKDREILKILDAFSAVFIRGHEILAVTAPPYDVGFRLWATVNPRTTPIHNTIDSLMNFTSLPLIGEYEEKIPTNLITAAKENVPVLEIFLRSYW